MDRMASKMSISESASPRSSSRADHRVRLTAARGAVREHRAVLAVEHAGDERAGGFLHTSRLDADEPRATSKVYRRSLVLCVRSSR